MPPFNRSLIATTAVIAAVAGAVFVANQGVEADAATTAAPAPTYPTAPEVIAPSPAPTDPAPSSELVPRPAPTDPVVEQPDGEDEPRFNGRTLRGYLHMDIGSARSMTLNLAHALNQGDLAFAEFLTSGAPEVTAEQLEFLMTFAPYGDASCFTVGTGERQCNTSSDAYGITVTLADDRITIVRVDGAANDGL